MCSVSSGRAWLGAVRSGRACAVAAIGDGGCSYIAEGLSQNTTLHTIFLNGAPQPAACGMHCNEQPASSYASQHIAEGLTPNTTLHTTFGIHSAACRAHSRRTLTRSQRCRRWMGSAALTILAASRTADARTHADALRRGEAMVRVCAFCRERRMSRVVCCEALWLATATQRGLAGNKIGDAGCKALRNLFASQSKLRVIYLNGTSFPNLVPLFLNFVPLLLNFAPPCEHAHATSWPRLRARCMHACASPRRVRRAHWPVGFLWRTGTGRGSAIRCAIRCARGDGCAAPHMLPSIGLS